MQSTKKKQHQTGIQKTVKSRLLSSCGCPYAKTRKRLLVEMLHELGLNIPYDRVLKFSAQLEDAAVSKYMEEGVVCPFVMRKDLFTTAAMDSIDHNPSATTVSTSFHRTSISLHQLTMQV